MLRKLLCLLIIVAVSMTGVAGCAEKGKPETSSEVTTSAEMKDVTLTFWGTAANMTEPDQEIRAEFLKKYPYIHINEIENPDRDTSAILSAIMAGNAPAFFEAGFPTMLSYIFQGAALPLDEYMDSTPDFKNFDQSQVDMFKVNGKRYAVPRDIVRQGFTYNKRLFAEAGITAPPTTWDEFYDVCVKLTKPDRTQYGFALPATMWGDWQFETWVWGAGGDLSKKNPDGTVTLTFDDPAVKLAADFWRKLQAANVIQPDINAQVDDAKLAFANEEVAIIWNQLNPDAFVTSAGTLTAENIGYFPYLKGPSGKGYSQIGGNVEFIVTTKDKAVADATWKWLMFSRSKENWDKLYKYGVETSGLPPIAFPRTDMNASDYGEITNTEYLAAITEAKNAERAEYYGKGAVDSLACDGISNWFTDPNADVMAVMKEAQDRANADVVKKFNEEYLKSKAN